MIRRIAPPVERLTPSVPFTRLTTAPRGRLGQKLRELIEDVTALRATSAKFFFGLGSGPRIVEPHVELYPRGGRPARLPWRWRSGRPRPRCCGLRAPLNWRRPHGGGVGELFPGRVRRSEGRVGRPCP